LDEDEIQKLLKLVERSARALARNKGLSPQDTDDFAQDALVKFIENDYAAYRKFRGEAQLPTYVASILSRLLVDRFIRERGKFRPSPEAMQLGKEAILLEKYVYRDGLRISAASEKLRTDHRVALSDGDVEVLLSRLPRRYRREHVGPDPLEHVPARNSAEDGILDLQRHRRDTRFAAILEKCKTAVSSQDALILSYWEQEVRPMEIARIVGTPARRVYARIEALKKLLRRSLEDDGIDGSNT
jgi:RNA polymerase sigma factor (sigma-70 family)